MSSLIFNTFWPGISSICIDMKFADDSAAEAGKRDDEKTKIKEGQTFNLSVNHDEFEIIGYNLI